MQSWKLRSPEAFSQQLETQESLRVVQSTSRGL